MSPAPRRPVTKGFIRTAEETSVLELVDNLLNKGVVLTGDLVLSIADVDLVYVRLSALLCAVDRLLPPASRQGGRRGTLK